MIASLFIDTIILQGGLIALHVAILNQELFAGLILSAPAIEVDPKVAGWFTVSMRYLMFLFIYVYTQCTWQSKVESNIQFLI